MTETPEQAIRWFHDEVQKLSAVAAGSLCLKNCPACAKGKDHSSFALYGRKRGQRFTIYVPEEDMRAAGDFTVPATDWEAAS